MQQTLEQYISTAIVSGTRKSFSRLHADFLENQLSNLNDSKNLNMRSQRIGNPTDGKSLANAGEHESSVTSGMAVSQPSDLKPVMVTPVDRKTLTGSTPGDFRSANTGAGVTDQFKNQAGPRGETTDTPNSGA